MLWLPITAADCRPTHRLQTFCRRIWWEFCKSGKGCSNRAQWRWCQELTKEGNTKGKSTVMRQRMILREFPFRSRSRAVILRLRPFLCISTSLILLLLFKRRMTWKLRLLKQTPPQEILDPLEIWLLFLTSSILEAMGGKVASTLQWNYKMEKLGRVEGRRKSK